VSRDAFEDLTADLVERCRRTTERALVDAGVTPDDLDEVIVVGRAARMPAVRTMLGGFTRGRAAIDGHGFVARGAAIQAAAQRGTVCDALVWDVTPAALCARTPDGRTATLVRRNTATPVTHTVSVAGTTPGADRLADVVVLEEFADGRIRTIGRVPLDRVPGRPGDIGLMFHVDVDGILSASTQDPVTGAERAVPILAARPASAPPTVAREAELLLSGLTEL
jgi:molecular chaperone DnaK